ncbi:MAG TPA: deoxynucleoside kinase [Anaerolineales bacterium]|nr:deoxynucleoside kinase [Anaerolineales bacterium]
MYIAVEGVIGVGKTTLVRSLKEAFAAEICLEVFEENPFLALFYEDRERYAFQTQMFFLLSRYHQQRREIQDRIHRDNGSLLSDYTFDKDAIFARLNLAGDELEMYFNIHAALAEKIPQPDLVVYLKADTPVLMERIARRDRPYERDMEWSYIDALNHTYTDYFAGYSGDVLTLDTDDIDFVRSREDLNTVEDRIRQALKLAPFQSKLPLE